MIQVIWLDVRQDDSIRLHQAEGAVALVCLDDKPLAGSPDRTSSDPGHIGAEEEGRFEARLKKDQRQHR